MAAITAAVIAGLAALIGTGLSVWGSSEAGEAEEEQQKKIAATNEKQFKEQLQVQRRDQNMKGLDYLTGQRDRATALSHVKDYGSPEIGRFKSGVLNMMRGGF